MKLLVAILIFLTPQFVGLFVYLWRARHLDPRARLWGVLVPTLIPAIPLLLMQLPKPQVPGDVPGDGDGGASLLMIFVTAFHFTVALVAHVVAHVFASSRRERVIALHLNTRPPN